MFSTISTRGYFLSKFRPKIHVFSKLFCPKTSSYWLRHKNRKFRHKFQRLALMLRFVPKYHPNHLVCLFDKQKNKMNVIKDEMHQAYYRTSSVVYKYNSKLASFKPLCIPLQLALQTPGG